jgi:hypothetical protein
MLCSLFLVIFLLFFSVAHLQVSREREKKRLPMNNRNENVDADMKLPAGSLFFTGFFGAHTARQASRAFSSIPFIPVAFLFPFITLVFLFCRFAYPKNRRDYGMQVSLKLGL